MTLEEAYRNYAGQFIDIVECDEYYTTVSFKGKRDPAFFINVLGRMPRHHMTLEEKMDYLSNLWSHQYVYKYKSPKIGRQLYLEYAAGEVKTEREFQKRLQELEVTDNG